MSTNINFVNSEGLESDTRIDFNLPRTILLKSQGRAVADGAVIEGELCAYNALNALSKIIVPTFAADPATLAYLAATGITGATEVAAINNLVVGLKADGLWSKMKAVYPFVTDNSNLLSYTTTFINPNYQTDNTATFTLNNVIAPDGTNTGVRFTAVGSNNNYFYSANTIGGNNFGTGNKAFSIYIKAGTFSGSIALAITSDGSTLRTNFALTNDWQRITITKNVIVAGNNSQYFIDMNSTTMTSGQFFYIWSPQFENGTTATTYQPILTTQQAYIANQFKYNLVNPVDSDAAFRLVFNGGWTHSSTGATPNGTNGFADTFLIPSSVLAQNSTHFSNYFPNFVPEAKCQIGTSDIGNINSLYVFYRFSSTIGAYIRANSTLDTFENSNQVSNSGLRIVSRTASNSTKVFVNNTNNYLSTLNSSGLSTYPISLSARNTANVRDSFSALQQSFSTIGDGLTDTEAANLYTRVQAYQTALSRNV